jgi:cell division protein FtsQ
MRSKLRKVISIVLILGGIGVIMAFSLIKRNDICGGVELNVLGDKANKFVTKDNVEELLNSLYVIRPGQTKTNEINTERLEALIKANPYVNDANCYFSQSGKLVVDVKPKQPVIRVFNGSDISYYLDNNGRIIPLSNSFVADVPLFTIEKLEATLEGQQLKGKMIGLGNIIANDTLWNNATEQIAVTNDGQFSLFTNITNQTIKFGDTSDALGKFAKLTYFYKEVLPKGRWDKYKLIDLSYKNQIVAENNFGVVNNTNSIDASSRKAPSAIPVVKKSISSSMAVAAPKKNIIKAKPIVKQSSKTEAKKSVQKETLKIAKPVAPKPKVVVKKDEQKKGTVNKPKANKPEAKKAVEKKPNTSK